MFVFLFVAPKPLCEVNKRVYQIMITTMMMWTHSLNLQRIVLITDDVAYFLCLFSATHYLNNVHGSMLMMTTTTRTIDDDDDDDGDLRLFVIGVQFCYDDKHLYTLGLTLKLTYQCRF